jgi:acetyltransferase EpsM
MRVIGDGGHARAIQEILDEHANAVDGTVIAIGDNAARKKVISEHPMFYPPVISNKAIVSKGAFIGQGTVVMPGAIVRANARIGSFVILNTGCTVDHDCIIGDYAHIAPGAHLCGHVEVGEGALVGVGVGIAPMCRIPPWVLVKARKLEMEPLYAV